MKKQLLLFGATIIAFALNAQTPLETFRFTSGNTIGENGSTGTGSASSITDYTGTPANAIYLDGTQSIDYGNLALNTTSGISFSFWLKPDESLNGAYRVFGKRGVCSNTNMVEVSLNGSNGLVSLAVRTSSGLAMSVRADYLEGVWQQFTFTVDKSDGKARVYRNGEYLGVSSTGISPSSIPATFTGNFLVANGPCVGVDGTKKYQGGFDDLEIYNSTLTAMEIQTSYAASNYDASSFRAQFIEQSLLVHHAFDSTLVSQKIMNEAHIADKDGNKNKALDVQKDRAYDLGNPSIITGNGVSFSFWIRPDVFTGSNIIFGKRSVCTWDNMFAVNANGTSKKINLELRSTAQQSSSVSVDYTPSVWQKITFTIDNAAGKLYSYKNGILEDSSTMTTGSIPSSFTTAASLVVGDGICATNSGMRYNGGIDEIYIYEQTLTPSQIADAFINDNDNMVISKVSEKFDEVRQFFIQNIDVTDRFDPATTTMNTALSLDGATSHNLGNPRIATNSNAGYTFSFWINPETGVGVDQMLFSKRSVCTWTNMFAFRVNGGTDKVTAEFRTTAQKAKAFAIDYIPGEWQQISFTVDFQDKKIRGYRNGVKVDSSTFVGNEFVTNYSSANLFIASDPCNVTMFKGGLDELKIYSIPLEDSEVRGKFQSEIVTELLDFVETKESLELYPNPASSIIYTEEGQLEIFDALGNQVLEAYSEGQLNISNLDSGLYIVIQNSKRTKLIVE